MNARFSLMNFRRRFASVAILAAAASLARAHPDHDEAATATAAASISVEGAWRTVVATGLPDHETGRFPGPGNPNRVSAQDYRFRFTATPKAAARPTPIGMNRFGVAVNGVVFDPSAAEWWRDDRSSGWQYEALGGGRNLGVDAQHAHVQPTGAYHYHGLPTALWQRVSDGGRKMALLGWAFDGFPIYGPLIPADDTQPTGAVRAARSSYRLRSGSRPANSPGGAYDGTFTEDWIYVAGAGDLDESNGRFGPTPEFPQGTYYYVVTEQFPFLPRSWHGTPGEEFTRRRPPPPGGRPRRDRERERD